jgi:hypothetical protein
MFYTDVLNDDMLQTLGIRYVFVRNEDEHDPILAKSPKFLLLGRKDVFGHVYEYLRAKAPYRWEHEDSGVDVAAWIPGTPEF